MLRQYLCECTVCKKQCNLNFKEEPFPLLGDAFLYQCSNCGTVTQFQRVATRKAVSEIRAIENERALKCAIEKACAQLGFTCSFIYQSVIIKTPISHWKFDYHTSRKTLWHESTYKINLETGEPAFSHKQFNNKKMSWQEVIAYIYSHDQWRAKQTK